MAEASHSLVALWRRLAVEQRVAAVGAVLLAISTIGPFSFVEAAELLVAVGVLLLLRQRALGKRFHLPFGDGTVILAAGVWAALLIAARVFDRPLGQNLLALACAAILAAAGTRERLKRPPDDVPGELDIEWEAPTDRLPRHHAAAAEPPPEAEDEAETDPLPPPEFDPPRS